MINKMQLAIIKKDLRGITASRNLIAILFIVPFVFTVVLPTVFILIFHYMPQESSDLQKMLDLLPGALASGDVNRDIVFLLINRIMPVFFMLIPIMAASVMAASSFVGEKEKRTLETLFYCPLSLKKIFQAKIIASFALSMIVSFISFFVLFFVTQIEVFLTTGNFLLPDIIWLITMLLIAPAISLIAITLIVRGSAKAQTMEESQQRSMFMIFPILLLIVGQFTGLILINVWLLLGLGVFLAIIAFLLIQGSVRKSNYELLLK